MIVENNKIFFAYFFETFNVLEIKHNCILENIRLHADRQEKKIFPIREESDFFFFLFVS